VDNAVGCLYVEEKPMTDTEALDQIATIIRQPVGKFTVASIRRVVASTGRDVRLILVKGAGK